MRESTIFGLCALLGLGSGCMTNAKTTALSIDQRRAHPQEELEPAVSNRQIAEAEVERLFKPCRCDAEVCYNRLAQTAYLAGRECLLKYEQGIRPAKATATVGTFRVSAALPAPPHLELELFVKGWPFPVVSRSIPLSKIRKALPDGFVDWDNLDFVVQ